MRPETMRFQFGRRTRFVLGAGVITRFFQAEAVEGKDGAVTGHILRPKRQCPCCPVPHPPEASKVAVEQRHGLMRHEVERIPHQVPVQHRCRRTPCAHHRLLQRRPVPLFPLIHRQASNSLKQGSGVPEHGRIVGQHKQPSLRQMRHGEIGRRLTRHVEQARGVTVAEVESSHRLIIQRDGFGGRTGYRLSLSVLDHGAPHCCSAWPWRRRCSANPCWKPS